MRERTFVMLKPDTIQRSLVGEVVARLEQTGLKLVAAKMVRADEATLLAHYGKDDAWYTEKGTKRVRLLKEAGKPVDENRAPMEYGKDIIRGIVRYLQTTPLLAMVWEGNHAVDVVRRRVGSTEPITAEVGTIRGDLQLDSYSLSDTEQRAIRNLIHCSDQASEAAREIAIWFTPQELHDYRHINEAILED